MEVVGVAQMQGDELGDDLGVGLGNELETEAEEAIAERIAAEKLDADDDLADLADVLDGAEA